jgi:pimeloyl-ACP methyl ester carboxylesterase
VDTIPGPSESLFTETFGQLLPPAKYLSTAYGNIAYYTYAPTTQQDQSTSSPSRVLFLHGVQTPSLGLQPLATSLHTFFPKAEFVLVDLWGHGLSSTPIAAHTPSLFHSLVDSVLEALEWASCHLIGYSFGGVTAVSYISSSSQRAKRIESVALIAPAGLWKPHSLDETKLNSPDFSIAKSHVLELLEGGLLIVPSDWQSRITRGEIVAEKIREWQMQNHAGHTASVIRIVRDGGIMGQEEVFRAAVETEIAIIAVLGEKDDVVYEKDLKAVGMRNVVVVKGVGHGVVREEVKEVAKHIEEFWQGL